MFSKKIHLLPRIKTIITPFLLISMYSIQAQTPPASFTPEELKSIVSELVVPNLSANQPWRKGIVTKECLNNNEVDVNNNEDPSPPGPTVEEQSYCQDTEVYLNEDNKPTPTLSNVDLSSIIPGFKGQYVQKRLDIMKTQKQKLEGYQKLNDQLKQQMEELGKQLLELNLELVKLKAQQEKQAASNLPKLPVFSKKKSLLSQILEIKEQILAKKNELNSIYPGITGDSDYKGKEILFQKQQKEFATYQQQLQLTADTWSAAANVPGPNKAASRLDPVDFNSFIGRLNKCHPQIAGVEGAPLKFKKDYIEKAVGLIRAHGETLRSMYPGQTLYLRGKEMGLPGIDLQFNSNGTVLIHNMTGFENGGALHGGSKTFVPSVEYPTGRAMANLLMTGSHDPELIAPIMEKVGTEMNVSRAFVGSARVLPLQRVISAPDAFGRESVFVQSALMDGSLGDILKKSESGQMALTDEDRGQLWQDVFSAVKEFHQKGFIHRDLKPDNFLIKEVDGKKRAFLIDFDTVVNADQWQHIEISERRNFTQLYEAYESITFDKTVLNNDRYKFQSDWWAAGLTGFEILTGKPLKSLIDRPAYVSTEQEKQKLRQEMTAEIEAYLGKKGNTKDAHFIRQLLNFDGIERADPKILENMERKMFPENSKTPKGQDPSTIRGRR